jgi:N-acetyl-S-(2-succino)cysteine monooxygenase
VTHPEKEAGKEIMSKRQLHLGLALYQTGWDPLAWRLPEAYTGGIGSPQLAVDLARAAERGKFDHIFIGSSYANAPGSHVNISRWDSFVLAGHVAAHTRNLGLLVSANSSLEHPFFVARQLATLDHFSGGRAGINVVSGVERVGNPPANVGKNPVPAPPQIYARAVEFTEVLYRLLYSWDRDFLVDDRESGVFVKPEAFHPAAFEGEFFSVAGPLNTAAPIQSRIPNFHVGYSEHSLAYGATYAQARFSPLRDTEQGKKAYREHKARVAALGRDPEKFKVIPGVEIYPGATRAEALAKFREVQAFQTNIAIPAGLSRAFGVDLTAVKPTEKVFDVVDIESVIDLELEDALSNEAADGAAKVIGSTQATRRTGTPEYPVNSLQTYLRQWVLRVFDPSDLTFKDLFEFLRWRPHFPLLVGDAKKIADWLEEQLTEETLDGIQFFPPYHRGPVDLFVDLVVPELQRRGIFRKEYEHSTFERNLGSA